MDWVSSLLALFESTLPSVPPLLVVLAVVGLVFWALFQARTRRLPFSFWVWMGFLGVWFGSEALLLMPGAGPDASIPIRGLVLGMIFTLAAQFQFSSAMLGPKHPPSWIPWLEWLTAGLVAASFLGWPGALEGTTSIAGGTFPAWGPLRYLLVVWVGLSAAWILLHTFSVVRSLPRKSNARSKLTVFLVTNVFFLGGYADLAAGDTIQAYPPGVGSVLLGTLLLGFYFRRYGFVPLLAPYPPEKLVSDLPHPVLVCDGDGLVRSYNRSLRELIPPDLAPPPPFESVGAVFEALGKPELDFRQLQDQTPFQNMVVQIRGGNHAERSFALSGKVLAEEFPGSDLYVLEMLEISQKKEIIERFRDRNLYDDLTELPNRAYFLERLEALLQRHQRSEDSKAAVLFLDLDRFKIINDNLSHEVGDELLKQVASRLNKQSSDSDFVAHFRGDEFGLLVENQDDGATPMKVAERIKTAFEDPFTVENKDIFLDVCIGIAPVDPAESPDLILQQASRANRWAKQHSENRIKLFQRSSEDDSVDPVTLETNLRRAIRSRQFEVHYQPLLHLERNAVVGLEALVRWRHPQEGLIYPGDFIQTAEDTGLIVPIGRQVLRAACQRFASFPETLREQLRLGMHVNISGNHLLRQDIIQELRTILENFQMPPYMLTLEVTESALITQLEHAEGSLRSINDVGVEVCLDDFGTGFSSLRHLSSWPVSALKIDKSFVMDLDENPTNRSIVKSVIALSREMDKKIVAEGIETPQSVDQLIEWGCSLGQGYHFAKPLPPDEVEPFLKEYP